MANWIGLLTAFLVITGALVELVVQGRQLRNIRAELEDTNAIIKDTSDLRRILTRPLEGTWRMTGKLPVYQGIDEVHMSDGYLVLTWRPERSYYDVLYGYSVSRAGADTSVTTAICIGSSDGDSRLGQVLLHLQVVSRTDCEGRPNYSRNFEFNAEVNETGLVMKVSWEVKGTTAELVFRKEA